MESWSQTRPINAALLSFKTAPPDYPHSHGEGFEEDAILPYRDAEPYKASIYYWWWAFLMRNADYQATCASSAKASFGALSRLWEYF